MSVIAAVLSFVFAGRLAGVREGTRYCCPSGRLYRQTPRVRNFAFLKDMIFPESVFAENENEVKEQTAGTYGKNVIAIGRQFGSGGHDIGKALAEKLGYDFYDAEIIQMTAGTTGYTPEFVEKNEEIMTNSLLYDLVNQMYLNTDRQDEAPKDKIFEAECQVVRNLAKRGNCVIVGRCADYVLRNSGNCLKVFFSAPLASRIRRVAQRQNISEGEAKATVQKNEKLRADNYRYYTRRMWVQPETLISA
ncbi:MAG: AAA family ATPase [Lachnospiraceae bacterium]